MRIAMPPVILRIAAAIALAAGSAATAVAEDTKAEPFAFETTDSQLDLAYHWPAEVSAIPQLAMMLQADFHKARHEATEFARADHAEAVDQDRPFHQHYLHKTWTTSGQSDRLLSLAATIESFTGGAHGNSRFSALLWDRELERAVPLNDLFEQPDRLDALLRKRYCAALDAERLERRQGEVLEGQFSECPNASELVVLPADEDRNGRFDHIRFLAAPYVAGPYAEGEYEVALPIPAYLLSALKAPYRASFEAQPQ